MKLMMVCPTCMGKGEYNIYNYELKCFEDGECRTCHGKSVVEPSAQILDNLECAEIEREFIDKFNGVEIKFVKGVDDSHFRLNVFVDKNYTAVWFFGKTKLEALRKAKDWMDGRGAE